MGIIFRRSVGTTVLFTILVGLVVSSGIMMTSFGILPGELNILTPSSLEAFQSGDLPVILEYEWGFSEGDDVTLHITFSDFSTMSVIELSWTSFSSTSTVTRSDSTTFSSTTTFSEEGKFVATIELITSGNTVTESRMFFIDDTDPTVSIDSPEDGDDVGTSQVPVSGSESDDNSGVASVGVSVDGGSYQDATIDNSWSFTTAALSDGDHTLQANATDNAGNVGFSPIVNILVDTTDPDTAPPTAVDGFDLAIDDSNTFFTNSSTAKFTFTESDPDPSSGILSIECSLDEGAFAACTSIHEESLSDGLHNFTVKTTDNVLNTNTTSLFDWNVDTTAPETIVSSINGTDGFGVDVMNSTTFFTNSSSIIFEFNTNDDFGDVTGSQVDHTECKLDLAPFVLCESGVTEFSPLSEGTHTMVFETIDNVGNRDSSPIFQWTSDTTLPTVTIPTNVDHDTVTAIFGSNVSWLSCNCSCTCECVC